MSTKKLFGIVFAALLTSSLIAADVVLNPEHPDRYVVVKGDTLWDISTMFLRDPWLWPEIWYVNPQIENPHLIYPGDILTLVYVDGKPQLQMTRGYPTVALSPQVREESLDKAIPTIPLDAIQQFLTRAIVVGEGELEVAPYVVQSAGEHVVTGVGDRVYIRGIEDKSYPVYDIYKPGGPYIDPDTKELLGYKALFVGRARSKSMVIRQPCFWQKPPVRYVSVTACALPIVQPRLHTSSPMCHQTTLKVA